MTTRPAKAKLAGTGPVIDPRFARVVHAFAKDQQVTYGGRGFGQAALKVNGKIFAMMSSKQGFVVKLPSTRVDALVRAGRGENFDPGRGSRMKEWIALGRGPGSWIVLAREARRFVQYGTP